MTEEEGRFTIYLEQLDAYEFKLRFDWDSAEDLILDEPPPLGKRAGPNASRLLAAAAGNCLSASLLYCLHKAEVPAGEITTRVDCRMIRNPKGRLRVGGLEVRLGLTGRTADAKRLERCFELFEDFCVVTASIREGIPVAVSVVDNEGTVLHRHAQ